VVPIADCPNIFSLNESLNLGGITERYLVNSEDDFKQYVNYEFPYFIIKKIIEEDGLSIDNGLILDLCSGFGNTVIPLMLDFPNAKVVASDLSEGMLRILIREAIKYKVDDRLEALVCNAQDSNWKSQSVDLVVGGAALHHMIDPSLTISAAMTALKSGGRAIFLEPMEAGHCVFALALKEINELSEMMELRYRPAYDFLSGIIKDIDVRTHHDTYTIDFPWDELDDKWIFSKKYLEDIAFKNNCTLQVKPLNSAKNPFYMQTATCLNLYAKLNFPECLPEKAIKILEKYDSTFSDSGLYDLPIEAALIFKKLS